MDASTSPAGWRESLATLARRINDRVLPPVLEPGAMPWYSLFYVVFPLMPAVLPGFPQPDWALTLLAMATFLPLYFGFYWVRGWRRVGVLLAMSAMSVALLPANLFANCFVIFASVLSAFLPIRRMVLVFVVAQAALGAATYAVDSTGEMVRVFGVMNLLTGGLAAICNRVWIHNACKNRALRLSQDEIRRLAQLAERERIGRDLHDLLGHTLSVIALKSELAVRLFERDATAARREIADVERVAREALGQVRRAVSGMRAVGMRAEFANARLALSAVMVDFEYEFDEVPLHPELETVLALALREAATNVIRHAEARRCRAVLRRSDGEVVLQIRDDGLGGARSDGNGLRGMRERVEAVGGTLVVESPPGGGTSLELRLPHRLPPPPAAGADEASSQRPKLAVVR
ncbi:MAG TPA: sensor histidine kinase [Xanthomonadales bacterium]|nr:sensor histidine kinase [Xanthomonadales bacterium]